MSSRLKHHTLLPPLLRQRRLSPIVIECKLHQPKPMRLKRHVEYRRYAAIHNSRFPADLAASDLNAPELDPTALPLIMSLAYALSLMRMPLSCHSLLR